MTWAAMVREKGLAGPDVRRDGPGVCGDLAGPPRGRRTDWSSVALLVAGVALDLAGQERQHRLGPIEVSVIFMTRMASDKRAVLVPGSMG